MTGHDASAISQEGVCILACIFGEIGYLWPVFFFQQKIDTLSFIFNLPVLKLITLPTGLLVWGIEEESSEEKSLFLHSPIQIIFSMMRFTLVTVRPFPENCWII